MLFTLVIVMALFSVNTLKLQDVNITAIAAQNEEYQNESYLNITFKQDTDIKVLENLLANNITYPKSEIVFNSLTGLTDIAGKTEQIIINGEFESKSLINEFNNNIKDMVNKVNHIGSGGQVKNISTQDYELVKNRVKTYNQLDLFRYKLGLNFFTTKVTELRARGTNKTLTTLNNKLKILGIINTSEITEVKTMIEEFTKLKNEIDNELKVNNLPISLTKTLTKPDEKSIKIINEKLANYYEQNNIQNSVSTNINISKEVIEKVDKLIKTDQTGSKIISDSELKSLNLNNLDYTNIKKLLSEFNSKKEYEKFELFPIIKESQIIISPIIGQIDTLFNGINAKAAWCQKSTYVTNHWWGKRLFINDCIINDLTWAAVTVNVLLGYLAKFTPCATWCLALASFITVGVAYINYLNNGCGKKGVFIDRNTFGSYSYAGAC
jgi:hypothetical protein